MSKNRWLNFGLAALAVSLLTSQFFFFHDIFTLALLFPAIAIVAAGRGSRQALALGGVFVAAALYWSSRDTESCSAVWRAKFVVDKAVGRLEYSSWPQVLSAAATFEQCPVDRGGAAIDEISRETVDGHLLTQYRSPIGEFWIADDSRSTLEWLVWEISDYRVYGGDANAVHEGDVVVDAGAHIGVFTRYALNNGAARVIAIEPNPINVLCFKRNFAEEIASGRVTLIEEGVWDKVSDLELSLHAHDTARPTLHVLPGGRSDFIVVPVRPLDDMLAELEIEHVDFIKMDIEGAEREALHGAARIIEASSPRMAICTYHRPQDPVEVPKAVLAANPAYHIASKGLQINQGLTHPKVLYFY